MPADKPTSATPIRDAVQSAAMPGRRLRIALLCPMLYTWIELIAHHFFEGGNFREILFRSSPGKFLCLRFNRLTVLHG